jgi:hypothetical protein
VEEDARGSSKTSLSPLEFIRSAYGDGGDDVAIVDAEGGSIESTCDAKRAAPTEGDADTSAPPLAPLKSKFEQDQDCEGFATQLSHTQPGEAVPSSSGSIAASQSYLAPECDSAFDSDSRVTSGASGGGISFSIGARKKPKFK